MFRRPPWGLGLEKSLNVKYTKGLHLRVLACNCLFLLAYMQSVIH